MFDITYGNVMVYDATLLPVLKMYVSRVPIVHNILRVHDFSIRNFQPTTYLEHGMTRKNTNSLIKMPIEPKHYNNISHKIINNITNLHDFASSRNNVVMK